MFEWLANKYVNLLEVSKYVFVNPDQCDAIDVLRFFLIAFLGTVILKTWIHNLIYFRLKKSFALYHDPIITKIYLQAIQKSGIKSVPPLYQFSNEKPLAFTIGFFRSAIFLAPAICQKLPREELEVILLHELTHIKRRDNLLFWFTEIISISVILVMAQTFILSCITSIHETYFGFSDTALTILFVLGTFIIFKWLFWKRIIFLRELSCDDLCVQLIKDPLILASSLIHVWKIALPLSSHVWDKKFTFIQTILPLQPTMEVRVRRLIDYRYPYIKFIIGKIFKTLTVIGLIGITIFLIKFYTSEYPM